MGAHTEPGDLVVDLFSGSGTTAAAASALGREAIVSDVGDDALATTRARATRLGAAVTVERAHVPRKTSGVTHTRAGGRLLIEGEQRPWVFAATGNVDGGLFDARDVWTPNELRKASTDLLEMADAPDVLLRDAEGKEYLLR